MYVLNFSALPWIGMFFCWIVTSVILKLRTNAKHLKAIFVITTGAFAIFAFNNQPSVFTDLYRHYETLDIMRAAGISFYNAHELVTVFIFGIVARTQYNELLPFVVTLLRYALFFASSTII